MSRNTLNEHPIRPFRFGVVAEAAPSGAEWLDLARRVESIGFSTLLVPDTMGRSLAPLTAAAAAAAATTTLRVGTYVLANDFRNPVVVAREAAALAWSSGGRFELGIGAGRPTAASDYAKLGLDMAPGPDRVDRLEEALGILRRLLAGEAVSTDGPTYRLTAADVFPDLTAGQRPPILVAAAGPRLLRIAGRHADIVALGARPGLPLDAVAGMVRLVRDAAPDRFDDVELNVNLIAVGDAAAGPALERFGLRASDLAESDSPTVLFGSVGQMCDRLLARRDALGISYVAVGRMFVDAFAPVVERLAGR